MPGGAPKGNNNATKNKPWADAIRRYLTQNPDKRELIIKRLFDMAEDGNLQAIKEIADRIDGKPAQSVAVSTEADMSHEDWLDNLNDDDSHTQVN